LWQQNRPYRKQACQLRPFQPRRKIAIEVYQYAYPIVLMETTMRQTTAVPNASSVTGRAPINQFAYFREYPAATHGISNNYVLHFEKCETPTADAFWSLTMYDKQGFQVPNPINRFAIGDRDKLKYGDVGSLDIYIQAESPGPDKESSWLPSPKAGQIGLTLRMYSPRAETLNGVWVPPPFVRQ